MIFFVRVQPKATPEDDTRMPMPQSFVGVLNPPIRLCLWIIDTTMMEKTLNQGILTQAKLDVFHGLPH